MTSEKLNIPVDEYTSRDPITVGLNTKYGEIENLFKEHGFRHLPVVDGEQVVGIISERNLKLPSELKESENLSAQGIMTPGPHTVTLNTPLSEVVFSMSSYKIGSVMVTDENKKLIGIFTDTDALNALVEILRGDLPEA